MKYLIVFLLFASPLLAQDQIIDRYIPLYNNNLWVRHIPNDSTHYEIIENFWLYHYPNPGPLSLYEFRSFDRSGNKLVFLSGFRMSWHILWDIHEVIADFNCQAGDSFKINIDDSSSDVMAICLSSDSTITTPLGTFENCYVFKKPSLRYGLSAAFWHNDILVYAPGIPFLNDLIYFKSDSLEIGQLPFEWPLTSVPIVKEQNPESFALAQNYPNPFNSETVIEFNLPQFSEIELAVYDVSGREIKTILSGQLPPGTYSKKWNGTDNSGNALASGIYFIRLNSGQYSKFIKAVYSK